MIRRRDLITLLGSAATWPLAAQAQQHERMRRIGFLVSTLPADDPEVHVRTNAFVQGLAQLGWIDGRNMRIDHRFGLGDPDRLRKYAMELVSLSAEVILAAGNVALASLQQQRSSIPIVFANVIDPVGAGYVASLARPGGNVTGFASVEFGLSVKSLELLKQIAPRVTRVAVVRNVANPVLVAQYGAIQAVAPSFGVELTPLPINPDGDIERGIRSFVHGPNDGLIVTGGGLSQRQRDLIIAMTAEHRLPAVYPFRGYIAAGGLISYGIDQAEPYRLAAGYVDRILKGEKPSDLPVQAPTKYELVINLKTAKALGLTVPPMLFAIADEVIE
jgi:putative ABC transport system substrate-binding protein